MIISAAIPDCIHIPPAPKDRSIYLGRQPENMVTRNGTIYKMENTALPRCTRQLPIKSTPTPQDSYDFKKTQRVCDLYD
jgi:hypothetical protein